jgi:hypothetical protein
VRLLLSQFKEAGGPLEIDRSLDAEDLDAEFARVARALNGGLGPENLDPAFKFTSGMLSEAKSIAAITATKDYVLDSTVIPLGVVGDASWTPKRLDVLTQAVSGGVVTGPASWPTFDLKIGAATVAAVTMDEGKAVVTAFAAGPFATGAVVYLDHTAGAPDGFILRAIATLSFAVPHTT